ncbi:glycosyltransferase family 2 protein [Phenylobacterium sp.]|uniref:glycosyltransferase family 2 protein n=1 Tax=Phenylobacterium sp. TaxID=1871053 RepID=UPI00374D6002
MREGLVSVIVPHYDDLERLDICLAALKAQRFDGDFDIVVADNASPQGEAAVAKVVAGRARLVVATDKGAGPARNAAVAASAGGLLAFTDSDCVPEPDWLASGVAALERADVIGGYLYVFPKDPAAVTLVEAFDIVFGFDNEFYVNKTGYSVTASLFCPRAVFDAVGGFRVGVSEDMEWGHRSLAAGFSMAYEAKARVAHPARRTWEELLKKWRRLDLEMYGLVGSGPLAQLRWIVRSLVFPLSAVAHTPKVLTTPLLQNPSQRAKALVTLFRLRFWRCGDCLRLALSRAA